MLGIIKISLNTGFGDWSKWHLEILFTATISSESLHGSLVLRFSSILLNKKPRRLLSLFYPLNVTVSENRYVKTYKTL